MSLLKHVQLLRAELARNEASLAFAQKCLPEDLIAAVSRCDIRPQEVTLSVACPGDRFAEILAIFPLRTARQYLAQHTGTPVERAACQSLTVTEAAQPVHPVWRTDSDVRGTHVCWNSQFEGQPVVVEVQGVTTEACNLFWKGLNPIQNVKGRLLFGLPLAAVETQLVAPGVNPTESLKEIARFLQALVDTEGATRRGFATPELLTWIARHQFGLPVEVTRHHYTWSNANPPSRSFHLSMPDAERRRWHVMGELSQLYRQGTKDDALWYDLVELDAAFL